MSAPLPSTDDLRMFVAVAKLASFTRAALQLQLPRSTVSTAIQRLEALLGARLLQRSTRRVLLTDEGRELLTRSERLLENFEEIATLFQSGDKPLDGKLRVNVPLGMATGVVMARLPEFLAHHPDLQVDVFSTDRRVDMLADAFDCVVRVGAVVDESLVCRPLGHLSLTNVVSRRYVESNGIPKTLGDLPLHWLVNYQSNVSDQIAGFEYFDGRKVNVVHMPHRITVNNSAAYQSACRAGLGIAQLPRMSVTRDIEAGVLVEVLPDYMPAPMPINQLFPHRRNVPKRVRVFGDWLLEIIRTSMNINERRQAS
jgi:DNA-binding transcriptional LysR family regulator